MTQPPWLQRAWADLGVAEAAGPRDDPTVVAYYRDAGHPGVVHDEVAWCAAFLGAQLVRGGVPGTGSLLARSYLAWGQPVDGFRLGAVAVLSRGSDPAAGHIGFLVGETDGSIVLLGGNQGDAVSVAAFPRSRLLGLRWPSPHVPQERDDVGDARFELALAHVLAMEGGWAEDPHDPGGPTNKGITLATFAAWRGERLEAGNFQQLRAALRSIGADEVRAIYRDRYWLPCRAREMPAALGLMHFDAAVNHGVGGAARMLQEALGVTIDGEIGPQTLAAASSRAVMSSVDAYAGVRRRRYRALPHFWRFGRGWLNRVEATVRVARDLAATSPAENRQANEIVTFPSPTKGAKPMSQDRSAAEPAEAKWWGESVTVWGALVTAVSTVLPVVGPLLGLNVTGELVQVLGQQTVQVVQAIGGLLGTLMTIYGRTRATLPLTRRDVSLRL